MPFTKGHSGNPGGRPKIVGEVQELAREHSTEAIATLAAIMREKRRRQPLVPWPLIQSSTGPTASHRRRLTPMWRVDRSMR